MGGHAVRVGVEGRGEITERPGPVTRVEPGHAPQEEDLVVARAQFQHPAELGHRLHEIVVAEIGEPQRQVDAGRVHAGLQGRAESHDGAAVVAAEKIVLGPGKGCVLHG